MVSIAKAFYPQTQVLSATTFVTLRNAKMTVLIVILLELDDSVFKRWGVSSAAVDFSGARFGVKESVACSTDS
jgi:hypothetical protein